MKELLIEFRRKLVERHQSELQALEQTIRLVGGIEDRGPVAPGTPLVRVELPPAARPRGITPKTSRGVPAVKAPASHRTAPTGIGVKALEAAERIEGDFSGVEVFAVLKETGEKTTLKQVQQALTYQAKKGALTVTVKGWPGHEARYRFGAAKGAVMQSRAMLDEIHREIEETKNGNGK